MTKYEDFIPKNVAPIGSKRIALFDAYGNKIIQIPLKTLLPPKKEQKLYSFGALSDVHIVYDTATDDFQRALNYLNNDEDVAFTCICGDLTDTGTEEELMKYKSIVDTYSSDTPVYAIAGNHENYATTSKNFLQQYTNQSLYYSFTHGEDVFIMCGVVSGAEGYFFENDTTVYPNPEVQLQWLYETLEENRNKRCFLFQHILTEEGSGDALNLYPHGKLRDNYNESIVFINLLKHYHNVVFFHGHSHMKYYLQKYNDNANYDNAFGCHSIHIPSLAVPRDVNSSGEGYETIYGESEGYVVDVYENGIHLRGRDFVKGEFLPIASYWLDTTLKTVEANTFTDSTGTIQT